MSSPLLDRNVPGSSSPFMTLPPHDRSRGPSRRRRPASAPLLYGLRLGRAVVPVAVALAHARTGPTHERLERHATGRHPTMGVVAAKPVAVRPGTLMDGQPADPMTRAHREVFGLLALPMDDPPRHARPLCLNAQNFSPRLIFVRAETRVVISSRHRMRPLQRRV